MQKIMFDHRRFGLEQAVLERKKIMTRRAVRLPDRLTAELIYDPVMDIDEKGRVECEVHKRLNRTFRSEVHWVRRK